MRTIFTSILLLFTPAGTHAQDVFDLEGKIGGLPICLHLEEYVADHSLMGRYFYNSSLKDIVMRGEHKGATYTLTVANGTDDWSEKLKLAKNAAGNFTGTWTNKAGKSLPVSLAPIDVRRTVNPYKELAVVKKLKGENAFDYVRSSYIKLRRDSVVSRDGKSLVWFSETHCDMPLFRLGNGFDAATPRIINPVLDEIHFTEILSQLSCASDWDYNSGKGIEYTTTINYLTNDLLAFHIFSSYFCGGAHPDFGGEGYLLDLHSGRRYELDDIISFAKSATTEARSGFDAFSKYRSTYFAPGLFDLVNSFEHFKKPTDEDDYCDYTDVEYWNFPSWSFSEKGIEFTPVFFRAARSCEEGFLVPFSALQKFKNPAFPYELK